MLTVLLICCLHHYHSSNNLKDNWIEDLMFKSLAEKAQKIKCKRRQVGLKEPRKFGTEIDGENDNPNEAKLQRICTKILYLIRSLLIDRK